MSQPESPCRGCAERWLDLATNTNCRMSCARYDAWTGDMERWRQAMKGIKSEASGIEKTYSGWRIGKWRNRHR